MSHGIWQFLNSGGFAIYPLVLCSLISWTVILERLWKYRSLGRELAKFHVEALEKLLRSDVTGLKTLAEKRSELPSARLVLTALERLQAKDERLRSTWMDAVSRRRQLINQEVRRYLWLLGTIGSASPFIGLFGTVVGILLAFRDIARTGSGGFAVVASGISEALIATAAGIIVAVIAVVAYNSFQTHAGKLVLLIKVHSEELNEILERLEGRNGA